MKRQKLLACLIVTIIILSIHTLALAVGKHALLIGIQDYGYHPMFDSLNGPANDIEIVERVLRDRFGFQDGNFLILTDASATHSRIEAAFTTLIDVVKPGDFVYIHYSGHGSQTKDLNGDERDEKDEIWVSYGARKDESKQIDNYEVLDDEIEEWLARLYEKIDQIIFVSDSCHSATVSRGQSGVSRAVEEDERHHILGKREYIKPEKYFGVRVGAARDRESAIEVPLEDDKHYGLFTWYWTQALQQAGDKDTWDDVFKRAYTHVTAGRGSVQRPQIWGERRLTIGGDRIQLLKPTIAITEVKDDSVTIDAGILSGVTAGSVYRLSGAKGLDAPTLTITSANTFSSTGKAEGTFHIGDLVIEESHAYHFTPITVALKADFPQDSDKPLLQAIQTAFHTSPPEKARSFKLTEQSLKNLKNEGLPDKILNILHNLQDQSFIHGNELWSAIEEQIGEEQSNYKRIILKHAERSLFPAYALTGDLQQAEIHLYILHPKLENGQYICERIESEETILFPCTLDDHIVPKSFPDQPPEVWILTSENRLVHDDLRIRFDDREQGIKVLQDNLNKLARIRELKTLSSSRGSKFWIALEAYLLTPVESCQEGPECKLVPGAGFYQVTGPYSLKEIENRTFAKDEILTFTLRNTSKHNYYCYWIEIRPDSTVETIFPHPDDPAQDALIGAGKARELIDDTGLFMEHKGEYTIKFIASQHPIDVSLLKMKGFIKTRAALDPLEYFLVNAIHGYRSRISLRNDVWSTQQASFEVRE